MVSDVEESRYRLSARNIKKDVLYFHTINLMEEVLFGVFAYFTSEKRTHKFKLKFRTVSKNAAWLQ